MRDYMPSRGGLAKNPTSVNRNLGHSHKKGAAILLSRREKKIATLLLPGSDDSAI